MFSSAVFLSYTLSYLVDWKDILNRDGIGKREKEERNGKRKKRQRGRKEKERKRCPSCSDAQELTELLFEEELKRERKRERKGEREEEGRVFWKFFPHSSFFFHQEKKIL